jgi:predicted AAA+ superfamily ATPase
MRERGVYTRIWRELSAEKGMVLVVGPRQVGKTTLAKMIAASYRNHLYFSWDIPADRVKLIQNPDFFTELKRRDDSVPLIVFDELHKYNDWKNYLKGVFDQYRSRYLFMVTGSGRMDIYRKGGDSLAGRYLLFHMWPFTLSELSGRNRPLEDFLQDPLRLSMKDFDRHQEFWRRKASLSGFPEPYLSGRKASYRRWSNTYVNQILREDIRDLTGIRNLGQLETLYHLLPSRVGSPLSIPSLARDLKIAYNSVRSWLDVLERFFMAFSVPTWTKKISRAIQKERKVYLLDTPRIEDPGARFENMVALELKCAVTRLNDLGSGDFSLHFVKNKEQQEVDFLLAERDKPLVLVEAKHREQAASKALLRFQAELGVPAVQLVEDLDGFRILDEGPGVLVAPACQWLARLP